MGDDAYPDGDRETDDREARAHRATLKGKGLRIRSGKFGDCQLRRVVSISHPRLSPSCCLTEWARCGGGEKVVEHVFDRQSCGYAEADATSGGKKWRGPGSGEL